MKCLARMLAVVVAVVASDHARADQLSLITENSFGLINGAGFVQVQPQSTGTGLIGPFVRIQQNGSEQGYNTDGRPVQYQEHTDPNFTRSLLIASIPTVSIGGILCYSFLLDVNQTGSNPIIEMTGLELYFGNSGSLTGFTPGSGFGANSSPLLYTLGNNSVLVDSSLNSGSGSGDMLFLVPVSLLPAPTAAQPFFYLYSRFGPPPATALPTNDGFEEWATIDANRIPPGTPTPFDVPPTAVPAPPALILGLIGAIGIAGSRLRSRRRAPVAV